MDATISLDMNGKLPPRLRLVRKAMVAAGPGWYPTDLHVCRHEAA